MKENIAKPKAPRFEPELQPDLSLRQVSALLNVSMPTIYRLIAAGELRTYLVGTVRRVRSEEIERIRSGKQESPSAVLS